jgi:large subunit ribosomal protein L11
MAKQKKIKGLIKLQVIGGQANPSPPVGPALGQHGVNIMDFCKQFNAKTEQVKGQPIPVTISVYEDRSFSFEMKQPTASYLIMRELNLKKGSGVPNKDKVATMSQEILEKVAQQKMVDLNAYSIDQAKNIIAGTARSMGIDIEGGS